MLFDSITIPNQNKKQKLNHISIKSENNNIVNCNSYINNINIDHDEVERDLIKKFVNGMLESKDVKENYEESARYFKLLVSISSIKQNSNKILQLLQECNFKSNMITILFEYIEQCEIEVTSEIVVNIIYKFILLANWNLESLEDWISTIVEYFIDPNFQLIVSYNIIIHFF